MWENSQYIHSIASPQIEYPILPHNVLKIIEEMLIPELSAGSLIYRLHLTMNKYLTLSIGAMRVLLHIPAIPPEMKLFNIL